MGHHRPYEGQQHGLLSSRGPLPAVDLAWPDLVDAVQDRLCLPEVDEKALAGLKFSEALPRHLAVATLAARLADLNHARAVLMESTRFEW